MCSLLSLLPMAVVGQTAASLESAYGNHNPQIREAKSTNGWKGWWDGELQRTKNGWFLLMPSGIGNMVAWNYVDGYCVGPHATIGHIQKNSSRWEIEETVRRSFDRKTWLMKGALRWYAPITHGTMIELRAGRHSVDFDHNSAIPVGHTSMLASVFGYNHSKMLERTEAGLQIELPMGAGLDLKGNVSWEQRKALENCTSRGIFGIRAQDNTPRIREPHSVRTMTRYEGPIDGEMTLVNLQLTYQPNRTLYIVDDMHSFMQSASPKVQLNADAGYGDWKYLTLGLQVSHTIPVRERNISEFSYLVGAGNTFKDGELGLVDWHHFDATRYWLQPAAQLSRFSMLGNYELSTDRHWVEGHLELKGNWLLAKNDPTASDVLQVHMLAVPSHRFYYEWQYALEVESARLGLGFSMDGLKIHRWGIVVSMDIEQTRKARKNKSR